jgi:hypothetical protein
MCGRSAPLTRLTSRLPLLLASRAGLRPTRRPVGACPSHKHSAQNSSRSARARKHRYHGNAAAPRTIGLRSAVQRWKPHHPIATAVCAACSIVVASYGGFAHFHSQRRQGTGSGAMAIRTSGLGRDGVGPWRGAACSTTAALRLAGSSCAFQMHSVASGAPKRRGPV